MILQLHFKEFNWSWLNFVLNFWVGWEVGRQNYISIPAVVTAGMEFITN